MKLFNRIKEIGFINEISELQNCLCSRYPKMKSIEEYFEINGFNDVVSQNGIDLYNSIIGGYSVDDGSKIQGLNEYINLYNQKNKERIPKLKPLFKQILSDRTSISFILDNFDTDIKLLDAIKMLCEQLFTSVLDKDNQSGVYSVLSEIQKYDLKKVYIKNDSTITDISSFLYEDWSIIRNAISNDYDINHKSIKKNTESYQEKKKKELKKIQYYDIAELNRLVEMNGQHTGIQQYFSLKIEECINRSYKAFEKFMLIDFEAYEKEKISLKKEKTDVAIIKELLDSIKEIQWMIQPLMVGDKIAEKDEEMYGELAPISEKLNEITHLYNKVRNYVTSKPYSEEKVKLNFGNPQLLGGWPVKRETATSGMIFRDKEFYYLGIIVKGKSKFFKDFPQYTDGEFYEKMIYNQIADPQKDVQNLMVIGGKTVKKNGRKEKEGPNAGENILLEELKDNHLPENINRIRKCRSYSRQSEIFNREDLNSFIEYYRDRVIEYYDEFDFEFKNPDEYRNFGEFTDHINAQAYQVKFRRIPKNHIDSLVDCGALYLFKIYNKDFSAYSKGTPNLHTIYWKALFDDNNLSDVIYKLNGEAEVFFRKASIKEKEAIVHPAGQEIKNKDPQNDKKSSLFEYDLIKDRRYTCNKFQFHVPITMNFKAKGCSQFNAMVNREIKKADGIHIIGIDRGERNLLYLCIIDQSGNIVEQMSLNEIITYDAKRNIHKRDYHAMLEAREKENVKARQNWNSINSIKELKEEYLSQVVHVITELMIRYNAIIVLEDLNFGFKKSRQKFERQVYQKFEKMLIDKLNYYVDKNKSGGENGGFLKAYQLTDKFVSFQKIKNQTGFLYYIPAWNTSKMDSATGFTNLFYTKYESIEKSRSFINNIDKIFYDDKEKCLVFDIDYSKFTYKAEGTKNKWRLYARGKRIINFRNKEKNNEWDTKHIMLMDEFEELFDLYGIDLKSHNLIESIVDVEKADFYKKFMELFSWMVQLRNSDEKNSIDCIISPVKNSSGEFFVTGSKSNWPSDADANGAYNIAKKGLMIVERIKAEEPDTIDKVKLFISNKEWLKYSQENHL